VHTLRVSELPSYTYADFQQWKGDWELVEGIPYAMTPGPVIRHQGIASKIVSSLDGSIEGCAKCLVLHEQDWMIDEATILRPDVVLVCDEPGDAYITRRPEIIFEVISHSSIKMDEQIKLRIYADEKVPYYVIVYPDVLKASVFRFKGDHYAKVADFTHENLDFDALPYQPSVDFNAVFKRFR
jgi:Uma2 family endonuclease